MEEVGWLCELAVLLRMPICSLVDTLPANELVIWREWLMEPRGDRRADWRAAQIAKSVHDVALGFNGKPNPQQLDSYLLSFRTLDPAETNKRCLESARAIFGKVIPC